MTDRELLQQALDALAQSWVNDHHGNRKQVLAMCADDFEKPFQAMLALRKRLAQCDRCGKANPAKIHTCTPNYVDRRQWLYDPMTGELLHSKLPPRESSCAECGKKASEGWALYCVECSKPMREWVGLTDAEVEEVFFDMGQFAKIDLKTFARAIEAKLKEKNALPSP